MKKRIRLGVNVDHIATLRQARQETFPDPVAAAKAALRGGAHGIVAHLREDRRHIQDDDMRRLRKIAPFLDMEMAATSEMQAFAIKLKPDIVCLVPEKREELTTEGGLDVKRNILTLKPFIKKLQDSDVAVSLFIDPEPGQIAAASRTGARTIEIHTGAYANAKTGMARRKELRKIADALSLARSFGLRVNAGHGLDYKNVAAIARIPEIEELNIGFSIVARSVFVGMEQAVREMIRKL